jgi:small subunit ribosomal protein S20
MPIKASAKKAYRQSIKRKELNLQKKEAFKAAIKKFQKAVAAKDAAGAKDALVAVYQKLDKAAKTNVIASNKASRLKSRLSKKLAVLQK